MSERGNYRLLIGDVRERLREIAPGSVQTCITSPPYWGLRSYATGAESKHLEIGSEPTPEAFVATMVEVFRLVRDTLRDDGTLWLNLGDSYSNDTKWGGVTSGKHAAGLQGTKGIGRNRTLAGLPGSQQLLMPHRVALALQADGWYLRSTVIWHKRNPMAESLKGWRWEQCRVKIGREKARSGGLSSWDMGEYSHGPAGAYRGQEKTVPKYEACPGCDKCRENGGLILRRGKWRPTTGHEYVFLLSKRPDYFADGDAVAELASTNTHTRGSNKRQKGGTPGVERNNAGFNAAVAGDVETRNPRTVYSFSAEPYKGSHFATFPSELVRRLLLATSAEQCCSACGSAYAPHVITERIPTRPGMDCVGERYLEAINAGVRPDRPNDPNIIGNRDPQRHIQRTTTLAHLPTCGCRAAAGNCLVLDPFAGSGTTLQVAVHYGRDAVGCELSDEYAALAHQRIGQIPRCAIPKKRPAKPRATKPAPQQEQFSWMND